MFTGKSMLVNSWQMKSGNYPSLRKPYCIQSGIRRRWQTKLRTRMKNPTLGQRMADGMASFGGSWTFIICFMGFMLIWIAANVYLLGRKTFDPYPFILLNLILSCLAAMQAPVIMMSQKRQEEK